MCAYMLSAIWCIVISQADEPVPVGNYSQRKEEEKQMSKLSEQLEKLAVMLNRGSAFKGSDM